MIYSLLSRIGIEVWKKIPDFENYQVSNLGNVRSLNYRNTGKVKVLTPEIEKSGRSKFTLCKKGKGYHRRSHVLVAMAFLNHKPCGNKIVVDHIDNITSNNNLYNLQKVTQRYNLSKELRGSSKYTGVCWDKTCNKWKSQIRINGKSKHLGRFENEKEASEVYQKALKELLSN